VGRLRVAGTFLGDPAANQPLLTFTVTIPESYAVVAEIGTVSGVLDDTPYAGPRHLSVGRHGFAPGGPTGRLAVVWAKALERGFSPFRNGAGAR